MDLNGQIFLVTGAASGIGEASARLAASRGAQVFIADIKAESLDKVLTSLEGANHGALTVDVSTGDSVNDLYDQLLKKTNGKLPNAVIHSAGVIRNIEGIAHCSEETFDEIIRINVKGTYLINRKFAMAMKEHGVKGSIVNISSISAHGLYLAPAYSASKGAVNSFTLALAKEMGFHGIRVNAVAPGTINTQFGGGIRSERDLSEILSRQQTESPIPLQRLGDAKEVAEVCVFLASPAASYVTASIYEVNGGIREQVATMKL